MHFGESQDEARDESTCPPGEAIEILTIEDFQESEMIAKKIALSLGFYINPN